MSVSAVKNENWKPESAHGRKDGHEKMLRQETLWQSRPVRSNGFAWKINYCGIFCASQKGSERIQLKTGATPLRLKLNLSC